MDDRGLIKRRGFWALALLWLPVGVVATAALRFAPEAGPGMWLSMMLMSVGSLVPVAASLVAGCSARSPSPSTRWS